MSRTSFSLPVSIIMLLVGCSSGPDRFPVSGSVSLDGKPVGNCVLVFQSTGSAGPLWSASALVSNGKFQIAKKNGLAPGEYGVVFTETQPDLEDYEAARRAGSKSGLNKKFIPLKYTIINELRVQVAKGMPAVSLDLKTRAR